MDIETFYDYLASEEAITKGKLVDYFAYFLSEHKSQPEFSPEDINSIFHTLKIDTFPGLRNYLNLEAKKKIRKGKKYIKKGKVYHLERSYLNLIKRQFLTVSGHPKRTGVANKLKELHALLTDPNQQSFAKEALDCFQIGAFRASIVLIWILTLDHLIEYILNNQSRLHDFNDALSRQTKKQYKSLIISTKDDFTEIKESDLVEIIRSAKIISNSVRKILDEKLIIRNSAAHPSGIVIDDHKATEFCTDLLNNVVIKFK